MSARSNMTLISVASICVVAWSGLLQPIQLQAQQPTSASRTQSKRTGLQHQPRLRRPVAITQIAPSDTDSKPYIIVGNRAGSVSFIEPQKMQVIDEIKLSHQLDDVVAVPKTNRILAIDSSRHELIQAELIVDRSGISQLANVSRIAVNRYPVDVEVTANGRRAIVASSWSRRVSIVDLTQRTPRVLLTCDVPFAPRCQCLLDQRHCLVADGFGGRLAVVDIETGKLKSLHAINGHNIQGLAMSPDGKSVALTHQILHSISSTTRSIISWGGVISNTLHTIPIEKLLLSNEVNLKKPQSIHGGLFPLGEERNAAGDPAGVVFDSHGRAFIGLAGVHQVARKSPHNFELARTTVGRHPSQLLLDENAQQLYVVNKFDDTISVVATDSLQVKRTISLGKSTTRSLVQVGEEHFFDARLSLDSWYSCHSCHTNGHTTGLLNDNFGDSTFNTPKSILSLLGTGATEPWAWEANQIDLRNQIRSSITSTMGGPGMHAPQVNDRLVESMNSYIGQLQPAPGILTARGQAKRPSVKRGAAVFKAHGCVDCHRPPNYAHPLTFDVGVHDEAGHIFFNPPSLLGVSQRGPYFHDNRASSLRDVIENHDHDGASELKQKQINDLIDFLNSL